jgi:hypothetical protein
VKKEFELSLEALSEPLCSICCEFLSGFPLLLSDTGDDAEQRQSESVCIY